MWEIIMMVLVQPTNSPSGPKQTTFSLTNPRNSQQRQCLLCPILFMMRRASTGPSLVWSEADDDQLCAKCAHRRIRSAQDQEGGQTGCMMFYRGSFKQPVSSNKVHLLCVKPPSMMKYRIEVFKLGIFLLWVFFRSFFNSLHRRSTINLPLLSFKVQHRDETRKQYKKFNINFDKFPEIQIK